MLSFGGSALNRPSAIELAPGPSPLRLKVRRIEGNETLASQGLHSNDFFLIVFLEEGAGTVRLGSRDEQAVAGDLIVIAPGEVHDLNQLTEGAKGYAIAFMVDAVSPGTGAEPLPLPGDPRWVAFVRQACVMGGHYSVAPDERSIWEGRIAELEDELERQPAGYAQAARALLALILVDTSRVALPELADPGAAVDPVIAEVFALVDARFTESLNFDEIARQLARSPSHLRKLVRDLTGETVMHWLEERRMVEARRLLLETNEKVELIAEHVGFEDAGYFRRRFRRANGMPPQIWRQLNR